MIQIIRLEHNFMIQKVEILKMASKMAVIRSKTYLTNILDKKRFYFLFLWMFKRLNDTND